MRVNELIHLLQGQGDKEVFVKIENGLFYPIKAVKISAENPIIICKDILISAESTGFQTITFDNSVEKTKKQ